MSGDARSFGGREVQVIDLSRRLSNDTAAFEPMPHGIEYFDHGHDRGGRGEVRSRCRALARRARVGRTSA